MSLTVSGFQIDKRERDGWTVYTCVQLPGLIAASKNAQKALDDLPGAIALLIRLDREAR